MKVSKKTGLFRRCDEGKAKNGFEEIGRELKEKEEAKKRSEMNNDSRPSFKVQTTQDQEGKGEICDKQKRI